MEYDEDMDEDQLVQNVLHLSLQDTCIINTLRSQTATEENRRILAAIDRDDVLSLEQLKKCKTAFQERDSTGWCPMHRASVRPNACVLDTVLMASYEMSMEEETADGDTPLTLASARGHVENVKLLLQHGASPHNTNRKNETPLLLAVRSGSCHTVQALIVGGALVEQACLKRWTATHEAARAGAVDVLMLLLRHGGKVTGRDGHGVTPLGVAAEHGHPEALQILIEHGGDVGAQAYNGDSILYDAAGSGNLDCIDLLLQHGASANVASLCSQLPIHRAAYEGHYLALRTLIPITTKRSIRLSGMSPVHSAADGGHICCLELLIQQGFDVNATLDAFISENYGDMRKTPLYFAICNADVTGAEMLLEAGARTDLDPLRCLLVAVRAGNHELVRLLLAHGADVNCTFSVVSDTLFPTALQYSIKDETMLRLLLNGGFCADSCFGCLHDSLLRRYTWAEVHSRSYTIQSNTDKIPFCEFVDMRWMTHLVGRVVLTLLDYVGQVRICSTLQRVLQKQVEWPDICHILRSPRTLKHLTRLLIRKHMTLTRLNDPATMRDAPLPPALKRFLLYAEYDTYSTVM